MNDCTTRIENIFPINDLRNPDKKVAFIFNPPLKNVKRNMKDKTFLSLSLYKV